MTKPRILMIAGGGFQRFVPALGAAAAIRAYHDDATIVLLTEPAIAAFAVMAPYFDDIWTDDVGGFWDFPARKRLQSKLRQHPFDHVYDLEDTARSAQLFRLMHGRWIGARDRAALKWSGTVSGTALFHADPRREAMHVHDRLAAQLRIAGIVDALRPDVSWVARRVEHLQVPFRMTDPFVLVAADPGPGTAWPPRRYNELAAELADGGLIPVLTGFAVPGEVRAAFARDVPTAVDLAGRLAAHELIIMAWGAKGAMGPDNGMMHLAAAAGCRTLVLADTASDPALRGPRGGNVRILRRPQLMDITVAEAVAAIRQGNP